jgi:hypothetical protein
MTRRTLVIALLVVLALALVAGGLLACKKDDPKVVGAWPEADTERTTVKPAEPPRWPLTGLEAPSEDAITQRVVSVKIENSVEARPQTNLQLADVVYESVTEGGITRFNAIFHSQAPEVVGPVRSARLSDTYIVPQYHALFGFSGASPTVNAAVNAADIENLSEDAGVTAPFTRSKKHSAPHNLFASIPEFRAEAERRGMPTTMSITGLAFDRSASADTTPTITQITIPFSSYNTVTWNYDAATKTYLRVNNGKAFNDAVTGQQVHATNVVVMWAQHNAASNDVVGSTTYEIVLAGSGRATVFRNGQRYDCTWEATKDAPPVFKAADGTQVKLSPGNTWMQVIRTDINISMQ